MTGFLTKKIKGYKEMFVIWQKKPRSSFQEVADTWRKQPILDAAYRDAVHVLNRDKFMFNEVTNALFSGNILRTLGGKRESIVDIVSQEDQKINEHAQNMRKNIMEYLAENSAPKIEPALVLTTLIKDLERLGDYSKDLAKLTLLRPVKLRKKYSDAMKNYRATLMYMFELTVQAFENSNKEKAHEVMTLNAELRKDTDATLFTLEKDKTLQAQEAIVHTLFTRYFRRTAAHLENIASSVISPFPYMGFKVRKGRNDKTK